MSYCIYTGAAVLVHDVKAGDVGASGKLQTFLRALHQGTATCPLLQRSIDIINNSLHGDPSAAIGTPAPLSTGNLPSNQAMPAVSSYLPAFPYTDMQLNLNQVSGQQLTHVGGMDVDSFAMLDCFPENHMDATSQNSWF